MIKKEEYYTNQHSCFLLQYHFIIKFPKSTLRVEQNSPHHWTEMFHISYSVGALFCILVELTIRSNKLKKTIKVKGYITAFVKCQVGKNKRKLTNVNITAEIRKMAIPITISIIITPLSIKFSMYDKYI